MKQSLLTLGLLALTAFGAVPAHAAAITFGAPTAITCACNTLDFSGFKVCGAASFGCSAPITVTTATQSITFTNDNSVATVTQTCGEHVCAAFSGTGNANFDTALNEFAFDGNPIIAQLNGLTIGQAYQVQLFGLDDRCCVTACRTIAFSDGAGDQSCTFREGCNLFVLGTFTADATTQTIESVGVGQFESNLNAVVVRTAAANAPEPGLPILLTSLVSMAWWRSGKRNPA